MFKIYNDASHIVSSLSVSCAALSAPAQLVYAAQVRFKIASFQENSAHMDPFRTPETDIVIARGGGGLRPPNPAVLFYPCSGCGSVKSSGRAQQPGKSAESELANEVVCSRCMIRGRV